MAVPASAAAGTARVGAEVLAAALAASTDGIALVDETGRCVHVNPAGSAILGVPARGAGRPAVAVPGPDPRGNPGNRGS